MKRRRKVGATCPIATPSSRTCSRTLSEKGTNFKLLLSGNLTPYLDPKRTQKNGLLYSCWAHILTYFWAGVCVKPEVLVCMARTKSGGTHYHKRSTYTLSPRVSEASSSSQRQRDRQESKGTQNYGCCGIFWGFEA